MNSWTLAQHGQSDVMNESPSDPQRAAFWVLDCLYCLCERPTENKQKMALDLQAGITSGLRKTTENRHYRDSPQQHSAIMFTSEVNMKRHS